MGAHVHCTCAACSRPSNGLVLEGGRRRLHAAVRAVVTPRYLSRRGTARHASELSRYKSKLRSVASVVS